MNSNDHTPLASQTLKPRILSVSLSFNSNAPHCGHWSSSETISTRLACIAYPLFVQSPIIHETNRERDHDIVIFDHEFVMLQCGSPDLVLAPACLGCCNRCSPVSIMSSL